MGWAEHLVHAGAGGEEGEDLRAPGAMEDEVLRLEGLGATVLRCDAESTTMADPEGNEFCVEPGPH